VLLRDPFYIAGKCSVFSTASILHNVQSVENMFLYGAALDVEIR